MTATDGRVLPTGRFPSRLPSILFLLDGAPLFGGTKVVLRHAELLARRGHDVAVALAGPRPAWYEGVAPVVEVPDLAVENLPAADLVVATFWTTIEPAVRAARLQAIHYCQGFEYSYTHNHSDHGRIERLYELPLPAFVVSDHLGGELAQRFARPWRLVTQPLERCFAPRRRWRPAVDRPVVAVLGPIEIDWKGVTTALRVVGRLRESGCPAYLVRISQWPLRDEESALLAPDEYHCHLRASAVAEVLRRADLVLAPSWDQEGFGLPALEAMASGVPVIGADVRCYRSWAGRAMIRVAADDVEGMTSAALALLRHPTAWRRQRRLGLRRSREYSEDRAVRSAESAFEWIATGEWRTQKPDPGH